jgi:hypothetical protein
MDDESIIDILIIDTEIKKKFLEEEKELKEFIYKRDKICNILKKDNLGVKIKNDLNKNLVLLNNKIYDIENKVSLNFYIMETNQFIEKYKEILSKPIKVSFSGKAKINSEIFKEKDELVAKYLNIANKYKEEQIIYNYGKKKCNIVICDHCLSKNCFEVVDGKTYICEDCGFQKEILGNLTSYKDVSRVNISSKYTYERRVHFRDCMNQYQGKQNSSILQSVYDDLENQFHLHGLLIGNKEDNLSKEERFKNITKDHILLFLKETGHTKHYEDVFLIYYNMTGKKPNDISNLEDILMKDFETLSDLYDKKFKQDKSKKIDRKSFINIQYVLYQLLKRHKYPCKKEDFNILKTLDRKSFHDDIMKELFEELNWNFFSPQF